MLYDLSMRLLSGAVVTALYIGAACAQDITVTRDIVYARNGGAPMRLDLAVVEAEIAQA